MHARFVQSFEVGFCAKNVNQLFFPKHWGIPGPTLVSISTFMALSSRSEQGMLYDV